MTFLEALHFRHACKHFDPTRSISEADQALILECGRMSPSSFGLEPWHFVLIRDSAVRELLKPHCWGQAQVTDSAFVVVYLSYLPHHFRKDSDFLRNRFWRRSQEEARYQMMEGRALGYLAEQNTLEWTKRQSYLALSNMMTGAASLGIDSCPMEGFFAEQVKEVLAGYVDWKKFDLSVLCAFGYRAEQQTPRFRMPIEQIVTIV